MTPLRVVVPGSKSLTQRALLLAALRPGETVIERPLACDDSRHLCRLLGALGAEIDWHADRARVRPAARLFAPPEPIDCGNAGTAVRFGACLSLLCEGTLTLDGDEHMRRRPIGPLLTSLAVLGVAGRYLNRDGCPPFALTRIEPAPALVTVDGSQSSQYASGLLMVAPRLARGLVVELAGALVSRPYLAMTVAMMRRAGARVEWRGERRIDVAGGGYLAGEAVLPIERDWSAAAFVLAAARITRAAIEPEGLTEPARSLQGDAAIVALLARLDSAVERHDFDLTDAPDLIAPLAAACLFAARPARIRGAAHTRVKECDRIAVLARELGKLGAVVRAHPDGLDIEPLGGQPSTTIPLSPEGDHRMAMAFGVVGLRVPALRVTDPGCVSKSFPGFWDVMDAIRAAR